jgi:micrococcal nuclease
MDIIDRYKSLNLKNQIVMLIVIFIIALWLLPNILVYIAGLIASYYLINKKTWKYTALAIFSIAILVSWVLLIQKDISSTQENNINTYQDKPKVEKLISSSSVVVQQDKIIPSPLVVAPVMTPSQKLYSVVKVVDGDTVDVSINGKTERLRLIGINTPETVDPRKPVECFGVEASNKAKSILNGKKVALESDPSQGERDKYDRLLRYVFLEDGTNFNLLMVRDGFAYEYTYDIPYKYQTEFKKAQKEAMEAKAGLWGDMCNGSSTLISTTTTPTNTNANGCTIKGNISSTKEKIFHVIGCGSYAKTTIDESQGERWFCTEQEALDAGWRKALNCN